MFPTLPKKIQNIIFAYGASVISVSFILLIFYHFAPRFLGVVPDNEVISKSLEDFFTSCILAPLWEEALFRFAPIEITRKLIGERKFREIQYPFILLIAIVFGWMHGSVLHVFLQGTGGFFLGWVYIKNGYSYKSSVFLHFLWNFMLMYGLPLLIGM